MQYFAQPYETRTDRVPIYAMRTFAVRGMPLTAKVFPIGAIPRPDVNSYYARKGPISLGKYDLPSRLRR